MEPAFSASLRVSTGRPRPACVPLDASERDVTCHCSRHSPEKAGWLFPMFTAFASFYFCDQSHDGEKTASRPPNPCSAPCPRVSVMVASRSLVRFPSFVLTLLVNLIVQKIWTEGLCFCSENHKSVTPPPPWGQAKASTKSELL